MHRLVFTVLMQHLPDSQSGPALTLLTDALHHPQNQMRELAIVAISELPTAPPRRVAALSVGLSDPSARVRRRSARAIADQGPAALAALPMLLDGLRDSDASVRRDCAGAVGRLGPVAFAAAPLLVPLLADEEARTRAVVAVALKRIGRAALPPLLEALGDLDADVRNRCATLLHAIAPDDKRVQAAIRELHATGAPVDEAMLATRTPAPADMPNRIAAY